MRDVKSDLTAPQGAERPSRPVRALVALIGLYQRTAAFRAPRCRFHPTCSAYAVESLEVHGAVRGTVAAVRRILRCHPWNPGGVDPVEPRS